MAHDQQAAREMVNLTGQMGVPVTTIAGESIVGFNQPALKAAVARLRQQAGGQPENGPGATIKLGALVGDASRLAVPGQTSRLGAVLGTVKPGSLALQGGLREGDIITGLNGRPVNNAADMAAALLAVAARQSPALDITLWRDGAEKNIRLPLH